MAAAAPRLEIETKAFQQLMQERNKMSTALSKLVQQENENELVLKELKILEDDAVVYKAVGPILIKQDLDEARSNVEKRLQFIGDEMKRTQNHISDVEKRAEEKREKIMQMQAAQQQQLQPKKP